jgi:predicted permease
VLTLDVTMAGRKYNDAQVAFETYTRLWEKLRGVSGVVAVGGISALPLSQAMAWGPITVEGRTPQPGQPFINVDIRTVGADYFAAMQIPLVQGRLFSTQDTRRTDRVIVVDEQMARQLWPNESPIGKRVRTGGMDATPDAPWMTVVGVVGRVKQDALDSEPRMAMHWAHSQVTTRAMTIVVRTATRPDAVTTDVRAAIHAIDPDLPIYNVQTMNQRVQQSLARRRFAMLLLSLFACLALTLAIVGVYGVMAYLVRQGTRELGIRMALGATPGQVRALVVKQGMTIALAGAGLGLIAALLLTRVLRGLLFGVAPSDPATFAAIAALLAVLAFLACYAPARRAGRIDLLESLRGE